MMGYSPLGLYGRLPGKADLLNRRVDPEFLAVWERWLQGAIESAHSTFSDGLWDAYQTLPVWRFAVSAGVCGSKAFTGVLVPSIDSVGRYSPLTLVAALPAGVNIMKLAVEEAGWFLRLESMALSALEQGEAFELEAFDLRLAALGRELSPPLDGSAPGRGLTAQQQAHHFHLNDLRELRMSMGGTLGAVAGASMGPYSLWWSAGSQRVAPCWAVCSMLPEEGLFTAALDGEWERHGWRSWRWQSPIAPLPAFEPEPQSQPPVSFDSCALTHAGHVRHVNEDAYLQRREFGLWAVADGVGGQEAGAAASQIVVDALQGVDLNGDLDQRVEETCRALNRANERMRELAERPVNPMQGASTVAALVTGESRYACAWAGDSRVFRLRDQELVRCTHDHSVVQELVDAGEIDEEAARVHPEAHVITQAVGAGDELGLEVAFGELARGDRYLLCSDGVHGCLSDAELARVLSSGRCDEACRRLMDRVLAGDARDNVTAIVVDVT